MKLLVVGSGGREHALVDTLRRSPKASSIYAAPGNGGTREHAEPIPIAADRIGDLAAFAEKNAIDMTVVGPEVPLTLGIVDEFRRRQLPVIGPNADLARIEGSKTFTKHLCTEHGLPTASYSVCTTAESAYSVLESVPYPTVVKANGLAAGKGVVVAQTPSHARRAVHDFMERATLGEAGASVVIEEFLSGEEASFHVFADGADFKPMVSSQDHKRRFDGDSGPNTGGMGAYSVDSILSAEQRQQVIDRLIRPTLDAAKTYTGILYAGLMLTDDGPKLVEYNVRFGDPETQVILPRLETDLLDVFLAMSGHTLAGIDLSWKPGASASVVLVADTYPDKAGKGKKISGLEDARRLEGVTIYHAGTRWEDGNVYTNGGRILNVTAVGDTLEQALEKAYAAAETIDFDGKAYRRDIGRKGLNKQ